MAPEGKQRLEAGFEGLVAHDVGTEAAHDVMDLGYGLGQPAERIGIAVAIALGKAAVALAMLVRRLRWSLVSERPVYIPDYSTPRFRLTPDHSAYIKIAEGCNHPCSFCIIPQMRGRLVSRPARAASMTT